MSASYPLYSGRHAVPLDGTWDFTFLEGASAPSLADFSPDGVRYDSLEMVPGVFDATIPLAGRRGLGVYRREVVLAVPGRHELRCGGFLLAAAVFLDGRKIGFTDLPYGPAVFAFEADAGRHELVVATDNRFSATVLWEPFYDFYAYGGIPRPMQLLAVPDHAISRGTVVVLDLAAGRVRIDLDFAGPVADGEVAVEFAFDGGDWRRALVDVRDGRASFEASVPDPAPWSPGSPRLHTVALRAAGAEASVTERFGLRTVEARDGRILLNGEPVRLFGYNRHESDADFGPALPPQRMLQDLKILKDLHCNFIRGCHYPQNQLFLDLCDEMGFLVWEETLGWGNQEGQLGDPAFAAKQVEQTAPMVRASRNHPSVILWGFLNECASDHEEARPLIKAISETIRREDPTRLVTFACNRYERDLCLEFVDVVSFNTYPGWYGMDQAEPFRFHLVPERLDGYCEFLAKPEYRDKPFLVSEIGGAAIYGCHDRIGGQWSEEYQAKLLETICRYCVDSPRVNGLALWLFADSRTYVCGQTRPRGFNNKGTVDEYRRPKLAYGTVQSFFASVNP